MYMNHARLIELLDENTKYRSDICSQLYCEMIYYEQFATLKLKEYCAQYMTDKTIPTNITRSSRSYHPPNERERATDFPTYTIEGYDNCVLHKDEMQLNMTLFACEPCKNIL